MKYYYYKIIERNVDGCGSDADEYVGMSTILSQQEVELLQSCLQQAKQNAQDDCLDTGDMINDALEMFYKKTNISGCIINPPIIDTIVF